ncbi:MAG TPA: 2-dehydropantoate 2-reductase [Candidatus Sulfotelmatobacter sp.]|nr:2-dehydropantoate 2-reductase [Candidatus Sulfotelmatobacter sp.]
MRICIFGAGAVGGHLAARLAHAGETVSVIARGPHLRAMQEKGLSFIGREARFTARVLATDTPAEAGPQDAVIVAVKAPALGEVAERIAPLLRPETPVIFAMNGIPFWYFHGQDGPYRGRRVERLDPGGRLWRLIGPERSIGCIVYSGNEVVEPGTIRNTSDARNRFILGEPDGSTSERARALSAALGRAGIEAPITDDIRTAIWTKLVGNVGFSPVSALTLATLDKIGEAPEVLQVCRQLMAETLAVAQALGVSVRLDLDRAVEAALPRPPHKTSMLQDMERGRPMEIDVLLAAVQDFARLTGVPTPGLDTILALLALRARVAGTY